MHPSQARTEHIRLQHRMRHAYLLCAEAGLLRTEDGETPCALMADLAGEFSAEARSERADDERSAEGDCISLSWRPAPR